MKALLARLATRRVVAALVAAAAAGGTVAITTGNGYPTCAPSKAPAYGVDFGWGGPSTGTLRADGKVFGASYLSYDNSKNWRASQLHDYRSHCIASVAVWETLANRALYGYNAGVSDAHAARSSANALGFPRSQPIYFAVDFDSTPDPGAILSYFRGVDSVLGASHTGGYGGLATITTLFNHGLIAYGWQTYAWSYGRWDGRAQLRQVLNGVRVGGIDTDLDTAVKANYGEWPYVVAKPKPPAPKPPGCIDCNPAYAYDQDFNAGYRRGFNVHWSRLHRRRIKPLAHITVSRPWQSGYNAGYRKAH